MMMLSCKNVCTESLVRPPRSMRLLSKAFGLGGKYERYKVLCVRLPKIGRVRVEQLAEEDGSGLPLHTVRGHFKEFTEAAPLFGRYVGRFWWHSHIRGKESLGKVEKDYRIFETSGDSP